ncbi:MAG: PEP-CTERM sorting domain-containing protein, partial [Phycisphaerae bacterium]|nr:PEP-CTERM sorting domain-containing protein [Phycisphaerae bacterium]
GSNRGIRGGSFGNIYGDLYLRSSYRDQYYPSGDQHYIGFRVASVPEPCSLVLLGLGGLALIRRKRRTHNIKKVFFIVAGLLLALSGAANAEIIYSGANQNVTYYQYFSNSPISIAGNSGSWDDLEVDLHIFSYQSPNRIVYSGANQNVTYTKYSSNSPISIAGNSGSWDDLGVGLSYYSYNDEINVD